MNFSRFLQRSEELGILYETIGLQYLYVCYGMYTIYMCFCGYLLFIILKEVEYAVLMLSETVASDSQFTTCVRTGRP